MISQRQLLILTIAILSAANAKAQIPAFPLTQSGLVVSRPTQPIQPFTVAGEHGYQSPGKLHFRSSASTASSSRPASMNLP